LEDVILISFSNWHAFLQKISCEVDVFVPVERGVHIEYALFDPVTLTIRYNKPLPVTPVKTFFLPVKENVILGLNNHRKRMIVGIPACDLKGLELLDEIYLDEAYPDPFYKRNRENTILIGTDCLEISQNCHCTSYGVDPTPAVHADANLIALNGLIMIMAKSSKGKDLIHELRQEYPDARPDGSFLEETEKRRSRVREQLQQQNKRLPDYATTGELIKNSDGSFWLKQADTCVSCGACAAICPTCSCFLLIDRPGFDKVRQLDSCQYPGFEKIAAGEDPLQKKHVRFRNRYMCKYVWKPEKFSAQACTGCGRCIDCCIGNINKNKIFTEMTESFIN
jgi:sulfhydrogenase subunit beta (sulfur reductase)